MPEINDIDTIADSEFSYDGAVRDERMCPVCTQRHTIDRPEGSLFGSFFLMMRHWERCHPHEDPPCRNRGHDNGRLIYDWRLMNLPPVETEEEIEVWALDLEANPGRAFDMWCSLGYPGEWSDVKPSGS